MLAVPEVQKMMQAIRRYVEMPTSAEYEFVRDESAAYNDLCDDVNARLQEVASLIDRGLRDDAIELATRDGDLLAIFELIDIPQRDQWAELIGLFGLQGAPPLDYESATKLNAVHGVIGELQGVLRQHRILALARAPLKDRIAILEQLVSRDPENPIWEQDSAMLQRTRLIELQDHVKRAAGSIDLGALKNIKKELVETPWSVVVPPELTTKVKKGIANAVVQHARRRSQSSAEKLLAAYSAFDVVAGAEAFAALQASLQESKLSETDPLLAEIGPAMQWVQEQNQVTAEAARVQRVIGELEHALETGAPRASVEQALAAAESLGERLPEQLRRRARERVESFEMVVRRRGTLAIATVAVVLIAIAGSAYFFIMQNRLDAETARLESAFMKMVEEERWEEADKFLAQLDTTKQQRAVFLEGRQRVDEQLKQETLRQQAFADVLSELQSSTSDEPNQALVGRLRELAKTEPEKNQVIKYEARAEEFRLARKAETTGKNTQLFSDLQKSVETLLSTEMNVQQRQTLIEELQKKVRQFVSIVQASDPSLAGSARQIGKLLGAERDRMQRDESRDTVLSRITASVGDPQRYIRAIDQFRKEYPNDPVAIELGAAQQRLPEIIQAQEWVSVMSDPAYQQPESADANSSAKWLESLKNTEATAPDHPFALLILDRRDHLLAIAKRQSAIKDLGAILQSALLEPFYVYPDGGSRYFSPMPPTRDDPRAHVVEYIADLSMLKREKNFGLRYKQDILPRVRMAGQSLFAQQARPLIAKMTEQNFTLNAFAVLRHWHQSDDAAFDPVFKLFLLHRLLQIMVPASEPLGEGFGGLSESLEKSNFPWSVNWISPGDSDNSVVEARQTAKKHLDSVDQQWDSCTERMKESYRSFRAQRSPPPRWVGWIMPGDPQWRAILRETDLPEAEFVMIAPGQKGELIKLGRSDGKSAIVVDDRKAHVAGAAVYALP